MVQVKNANRYKLFEDSLQSYNDGDFEKAIKLVKKYIQHYPDSEAAFHNLGLYLSKQRLFDKAEQNLNKAIELDPNLAKSYVVMAKFFIDQKRYDESETYYKIAIEKDPENSQYHFDLAFLLLLLGKYEEGWKEYHWRFELSNHHANPHPSPEWTGQALENKTLLLLAEQGMGDIIQCLRYIKRLKANGTLIALETNSPLLSVLAADDDLDQVIVKGAALPEADYHIPIMGIPAVLREEEEKFSLNCPYVHVSQSRLDKWQNRLGLSKKLRIGIAWQGNPEVYTDSWRSIPLFEFAPLAEMADVELVSLQKGEPGTKQIPDFIEKYALTNLDEGSSEERDLMDTAAIMANMDLVICSDNGLAHLAGGLGVPTWLLLSTTADWRWLLDREDNPWYPSFRVFRQQVFGDWSELFTRIQQKLLQEKQSLKGQKCNFLIKDDSNSENLDILFEQAFGSFQQQAFLTCIDTCKKILAREPRNFKTNELLAMAFSAIEEYENALLQFRRVILMSPKHVQALSNCGLALYYLKRYQEAEKILKQAIEIDKNKYSAYHNLGLVLIKQNRADEADVYLQQAIKLNPENADSYNLLSVAHYKKKEFAKSKNSLQKALTLDSDHIESHFNLALTQLMLGNYKDGWKEYRWRLKRPDFISSKHSSPVWAGESLGDKTLLILAEQGMGDAIQCLRFIEELKKKNTLIAMETDSALISQLQNCNEIDYIFEQGSPLPEADFHIPIMSIPDALKLYKEDFLRKQPYLDIYQSRYKKWQKNLGKSDKLRVGIVWQGNSNVSTDSWRSIPLMEFSALANIAEIELFSLQKGDAGLSQIADFTKKNTLIQLDDNKINDRDLADTAAIMANLDLVICSDNGLAHLAGALGIPTWLLISASPDWRWQHERSDSPWYPSFRIFRQEKLGDWTELFKRVQQSLINEREILKNSNTDFNIHDDTDKPKIDGWLDEAITFFQTGKINSCKKLCEKILKLTPNNIQAIELLAMVYSSLEDYAKALLQYRRVILMQPTHTQALSNCGLTLYHLKRYDEAESKLKQAIKFDKNRDSAYHNLGLVFIQRNKPEQAKEFLQKALNINPKYADTHYLLSIALQQLGETEASIEHVKKAIELSPPKDRYYALLTKLYLSQENIEDSDVNYNELLKINSESKDVYTGIGIILSEKGEVEESIACFDKALALDPDYAVAIHNKAFCLSLIGKYKEAEKAYRKVISLSPDFANAHFNLATLLLKIEKFKEGWEEYRYRLEAHDVDLSNYKCEEWKGENLENKTIKILPEQGLGDMIQAVRYLKRIKTNNTKIILECPKLLTKLFSLLPEIDHLVNKENEDETKSSDFYIPIFNIPAVLKSKANDFSDNKAYLHATVEAINAWSKRLGKKSKFRVGIAWQGNPKFRRDKQRSIPLDKFSSLASLQEIELLSLQKGEHGTKQISKFKQQYELIDVDDLHDKERDFMDTAAIMHNLDLIITSDSSVAHLAGALGIPTWLLLPKNADWRWFVDRDDSPWYPSMLLFRQKEEGNWDQVFWEVLAKLKQIIE